MDTVELLKEKIEELKANPFMMFNNGDDNNATAMRKSLTLMKRKGYKSLTQEIIMKMIVNEAKRHNVFGVLYLTQFCVFWDMEFKNILELHMGQVDKIMRKYYGQA